jgi:hypothetical protein
MTPARIGYAALRADHIGRTITAAWPDAGTDTRSVTGEIESVTQYRGGATVDLAVGPLRVTVETGGVLHLYLHD